MKTIFLILYGLGAVVYAVYAVRYCKKKRMETQGVYLSMAISLARQQGFNLVLRPAGKCMIRCGSAELTGDLPPEECYLVLKDLRERLSPRAAAAAFFHALGEDEELGDVP